MVRKTLLGLLVLVAVGSVSAAVGADGPANSPQTNSATPYDPLATVGVVRMGKRGYFYDPGKWPSKNVYVCWDNPASANSQEKGWVKDAVTQSWQSHSKLRFVGWGACADNAVGVRITISDEGPHTAGLGTQIDSMKRGMVLNFTFQNWSSACAAPAQREMCIRSIGVHEFGHAIGFAHEQNRPDTPGECTQPAQGANGTNMLTPWDPQSVMNYCNPVYNNRGILSQGDITSVQYEYGAP